MDKPPPPYYISENMSSCNIASPNQVTAPNSISCPSEGQGDFQNVAQLLNQAYIKNVVLRRGDLSSFGFLMESIKSSIFVSNVIAFSIADRSGIKFGDQLLYINEIPVSTWSIKKVMNYVSRSLELRITIRERRFYERNFCLYRQIGETFGLVMNGHRIDGIANESPAARSGLLIGQYVSGINNGDVIGMDVRNAIHSIMTDVLSLTTLPGDIFGALFEIQIQLKKRDRRY